jgi:hypothetical protein
MALPKTNQRAAYEQALEYFRALSPDERRLFLRQLHLEGLITIRASFALPEAATPEDDDDTLPVLLTAMPHNFSGGVEPPEGNKWHA